MKILRRLKKALSHESSIDKENKLIQEHAERKYALQRKVEIRQERKDVIAEYDEILHNIELSLASETANGHSKGVAYAQELLEVKKKDKAQAIQKLDDEESSL